ncbi:hypothetical protein [Plebeiibacterium marinum]|uniref:Right handed beta helix domain-containing protein n=1 Tax=Plebeiibacterium marinum TaxID=2992111 RepID=A0AAE3MHL4_9BACT|nr:hypothetical protein [Plebeiobacterium marinum]MCW3807212.1 hypothetical protein [Plebeiobacterium marinum]
MKQNILYLLLFLLSFGIFSCEREFEYANGLNGLSFSVDTLMFDTIFSSVGSVTRNFRIYNPYDEDLIINSIELANADASNFRLNINGYAENYMEDVKINSHDSLYVFVDITITPGDENSPFVVSDSVLVYTGDKTQSVTLVAYGQDVVLLKEEKVKTTTFTADKPYLIYDYLIVDSLETLTIEPGARLHFYNDAELIVFGSMQVDGTYEEPVQFLGHRLEEWYEDKPGQWGQIHFMPGSSDSYIKHAEIKNSLTGLFVDSVGLGKDSPLLIENSIINHITDFGIIAQNSNIKISNSVIGDCGYHSVALTLGGIYNFYHCTIANYFNWTYRSTPALFLNNYYIDEDGNEVINPLIEANFYNSIIYGRNHTELGFDFIETEETEDLPDNGFNYLFKNCLIKSGEIDISDPNKFKFITANEDPNFIDPYGFEYQLDTLSPCKDIGNFDIASDFPFDLLNTNRTKDSGPDLGAYERIEDE